MTTTATDSPEASGTTIVEVSLILLFIFSAAHLTVNWLLPSASSIYPLEQLNNTTLYPARSAPLSKLLSSTTERCIGFIKCGIDINWLQEMLVQKNKTKKNNEKDQTFKHYLNVEQ